MISTKLLITALNESLVRMRVLPFISLNSGHFGPECKPMLGFNATDILYNFIQADFPGPDSSVYCTARNNMHDE